MTTIDFIKSARQQARCSRPVVIEYDDEDFPYGMSGSCALLSFRGRSFIVSVKHLLNNVEGSPIDVDKLRIPYSVSNPIDRAETFIPYEGIAYPSVAGSSIPEWSDVLIAPVDASLERIDHYWNEAPFDLDAEGLPEHVDVLFVRGFPYEHRIFEPFEGVLSFGPVELVGVAERGIWKPEHRMFEMRISTTHNLASVDGFSGAPVFALDRNGKSRLAGLVTRGGNHVLHVLDATIIMAMLEAIIEERQQTRAGNPIRVRNEPGHSPLL